MAMNCLPNQRSERANQKHARCAGHTRSEHSVIRRAIAEVQSAISLRWVSPIGAPHKKS